MLTTCLEIGAPTSITPHPFVEVSLFFSIVFSYDLSGNNQEGKWFITIAIKDDFLNVSKACHKPLIFHDSKTTHKNAKIGDGGWFSTTLQTLLSYDIYYPILNYILWWILWIVIIYMYIYKWRIPTVTYIYHYLYYLLVGGFNPCEKY